MYTRVKEQGSSHITVQSWAFVVANTNEGHLPWFAPVGMHYCKVSSRALGASAFIDESANTWLQRPSFCF